MKFYALKYKQLDLGLLRSSLEELDKTNRDILEDFEIHSYCKPLGRPPKDPPSDEMKSRMAKAIGDRNEIECSFGTGKRIYRANDKEPSFQIQHDAGRECATSSKT